jgi:hypothetical protein
MQATATLIKESATGVEDFRLAMRRLAGGVSMISGAADAASQCAHHRADQIANG